MNAGRIWRTILALWLWVPAGWTQNGAVPLAAPSGGSPTGSEAQTPGQPTSPAANADRARRRDPFHMLVSPKKPEPLQPPQPAPIHYPPGKRGLVIEQLTLEGIASATDGSWIAVVDNKTKIAYFLHEKDELFNGVVSRISSDSVVFLENSKDSSGKSASHEVVKRLSAQ